MFDLNELTWNRSALPYTVDSECVQITTKPETDLWQKTFAGFSKDNAPVLQTTVTEPCFIFSVKASFEGKAQYDQCGVILYQDSDTWLKVSIECQDENIKYLGSVATNHGYSDWATTEIPASITTMWYRLYRKGPDFMIEYSKDGVHYSLMRMLHMWKSENAVQMGVYACSPGQSSFTATFTEFSFEEQKLEEMGL